MATSAGIDAGSDAIKAVVVSGNGKGPVEILSAGTLPLGELGHMPAGQDKALALGMKLKELVKSARIRASRRRMATSGPDTAVRYLQVPPVPPWRLDMLVNYEVQERTGDKEPQTYDYHVLDVPEVNGQNTVMIGLVKETACNEALMLSRTGGLGEVELDLGVIALYNAYYHGHGYDADKTVIVCDIGAETISVLICRNGMLLHARTLMGGGRRFSQVIADELKIELAEAEAIKRSEGEISLEAAPASPGRSTLAQRIGGTAILSRSGNTNILQRPGIGGPVAGIGGMAGRAGASSSRPAPFRSGVQPGPGGTIPRPPNPGQPGPSGAGTGQTAGGGQTETSAESDKGKRHAEDLGVKIGEPGMQSFALDPSMLSLDMDGMDTLPPSANMPGLAKPANKTAPKTPTTSKSLDLELEEPAAVPQSAPAPAASESDAFSLELDLGPEPESAAGKAGPAPASPATPARRSAAKTAEPSELDLDGLPAVASASGEAATGNDDSSDGNDAGASNAGGNDRESTTPEERKRRITGALLREAAALCAGIESAVQTCRAQMKTRDLKIDQVYLTGGGSQVKGLGEFLSRRLRAEVVPLEVFRNVGMSRLPAEQAAALKSEQHSLAIATGAALANIQPGAFTFLLWPDALKQRKIFWSRGAYLYYAAAMVALALGLFLYTPYRNTEMLKTNFDISEKAVSDAMKEVRDQQSLEAVNEELFYRNKQVVDNTLSGHFFLNVLAELKNTKRITEDVWLTQISTQLPQVILTASGNEGGPATKTPAPRSSRAAAAAAAREGPDMDTFQAQRRIYLRGFVKGDEKGDQRVLALVNFYTRLVPHPEEPDHKDNLFTDIRPIWLSRSDLKQGSSYLTEFVLEAYTEGTAKREDLNKADADKDGPKTRNGVATPKNNTKGGGPADQGKQGPPANPDAGERRVMPDGQVAPKVPTQMEKPAEKPAHEPRKNKFITGAPPPAAE
jgi:Tfp pilus assembly PilM family ATPase